MCAHAGKASNLVKAVDAIAITPREFYDVGIRKLWKEKIQVHRAGVKPLKIGRWTILFERISAEISQGLSVSGGADSMCLAYLFKRLQEQNLSPPLDLTAFIIDHKARHDSTVEAHSVSNLLAQLGTFTQNHSSFMFC